MSNSENNKIDSFDLNKITNYNKNNLFNEITNDNKNNLFNLKNNEITNDNKNKIMSEQSANPLFDKQKIKACCDWVASIFKDSSDTNLKKILKIFYLIILLLINELVYICIFDLFFYNVLGEYTEPIFSCMNIFFICDLIILICENFNLIKKEFKVLIYIYFIMYLFIMIKSFCYNPWYLPFYLLFVFINFGLIVVNNLK